MNLIVSTIETTIIVVRIKLFPMRKVKLNTEIFLTQAIGIKIRTITEAIHQIFISKSKRFFNTICNVEVI
jgi:hypothetical protein